MTSTAYDDQFAPDPNMTDKPIDEIVGDALDKAYTNGMLSVQEPGNYNAIAERFSRDHADTVQAVRLYAAKVGEPVAYWAAVNREGDIDYSCNADDANGGDFARDMCNQHINGRLNEGDALLRLKPLYAAPPHSPIADSGDELAAFVKWWNPFSRHIPVSFNSWHDAALAAWQARAALAARPKAGDK